MKKVYSLFLAAGIMMLGAVACKEKKQSEDIITTKYVPEKPQGPIRMAAEKRQTDVKWLGQQYVITIERMPADTLPMVIDEAGQQYVDNCILLSVVRSDSSIFFRKTFTKHAFDAYLDGDYRHRGVLENMVFHEVDGNELEFAVVVSHPEADDEFIPLELDINSQKAISIARGNLLEDTDRDGDQDDDD